MLNRASFLASPLTVAVSHRDLVHVRQHRRHERVAGRRHSMDCSSRGTGGVHGGPPLGVKVYAAVSRCKLGVE